MDGVPQWDLLCVKKFCNLWDIHPPNGPAIAAPGIRKSFQLTIIYILSLVFWALPSPSIISSFCIISTNRKYPLIFFNKSILSFFLLFADLEKKQRYPMFLPILWLQKKLFVFQTNKIIVQPLETKIHWLCTSSLKTEIRE